MDYEQVKQELECSPTFKLLRSPNAALIVSFLYAQFKAHQQITIGQTELESKLSDYLSYLQDLYPDRYPSSAKDYLRTWCDSQLLRKTFERSSSTGNPDEPVFTLTPATEKAIAWLEELQQRDEFVGTESRFLQIFRLLQDIRAGSTVDVAERVRQLEAERDQIQQEIDDIQAAGKVDRFTRTQLQERFLLANQVTRQLIADFREIEQNFRALTRNVQAAQLAQDSRKGTVIGQVLDADQELKDSDQGQSFYGFWRFLMSATKRQELKELIRTAYDLEELRSLTADYPLLRRIERNLLNAGEHIVQSNQHLTEKLRQMLDERSRQENRRVAELISEVQRLALAATEARPTEPDFWQLQGPAHLDFSMARPLHPLEKTAPPTFDLDFTERVDLTTEAELAELFEQFYVDEQLLQRQIDQALSQRSRITLADLLHLYPVSQGLPEVVAYLAIATQSPQYSVDPSQLETLVIPSLDPNKLLELSLPRIVFYH
ncbi:MAG: DUF3375 domain-containing protein [Spirulina sp. SIO3F2]|nr:DUF3375 domain-containing protein [Spirulina sp. SIO3F2]